MKDEVAFLFMLALFAIGAVAVILWQHGQSTAQILAAAGANAPGVPVNAPSGPPVANASLAGTPAPTAASPGISVPLNIYGGGYLN